MSGYFRPSDVAACARCGSGRVRPKLLVMGPIAGIDSDSRSFICESCGYEALPVMFDTEETRAKFEAEARGGAVAPASESREGSASIPILPVLTEPLIDVRILDKLPVRLASIVGATWDGSSLTPTGYRVSYQEYWDAIGGPRDNAGRVLLLDLTELYALSAEILPSLDWDGKVVWGDPREERTDLRVAARALRSLGFPSLCVMDLRRPGAGSGPDPAL